MSAQRLREAARLIRERAAKAEVAYRDAPEAQKITVADAIGDHLEAFGHPHVALAVAAWLEAEAASHHPHAWDASRIESALAVADAYLAPHRPSGSPGG